MHTDTLNPPACPACDGVGVWPSRSGGNVCDECGGTGNAGCDECARMIAEITHLRGQAATLRRELDTAQAHRDYWQGEAAALRQRVAGITAPQQHGDAWTVASAYTLTPQDIEDIWSSAINGGVNHWAAQANGALGDPGAFSIIDHDGNEYLFTSRDIAKAVASIINRDIIIAADIRHDIANGDIDATAADCIIQIAALGDITYG